MNFKNEIRQLLSKYKQANDIRECEKQQYERTTQICAELVAKIRHKKFE